jgi:hypothetical protein
MEYGTDWPLSVWYWPRQTDSPARWTAGHVDIKLDGSLWHFRPKDVQPQRLTRQDSRRQLDAEVASHRMEVVIDGLHWMARVHQTSRAMLPEVVQYPLEATQESVERLRELLTAPSQNLPKYCPTCMNGAQNCSVFAASVLRKSGILPPTFELRGKKFFLPEALSDALRELSKGPGSIVLPPRRYRLDGERWMEVRRDSRGPNDPDPLGAVE